MSPRSLFKSQHDSTNDCEVTVIAQKQPLPVSKLTTTTQVDTDINNYDNINSMATPKNQHHRTTLIPETTTTTTPVQANFNSCLRQMSSSALTTSLKLPPSEK